VPAPRSGRQFELGVCPWLLCRQETSMCGHRSCLLRPSKAAAATLKARGLGGEGKLALKIRS